MTEKLPSCSHSFVTFNACRTLPCCQLTSTIITGTINLCQTF